MKCHRSGGKPLFVCLAFISWISGLHGRGHVVKPSVSLSRTEMRQVQAAVRAKALDAIAGGKLLPGKELVA